jgi:SAM-dependent methyltransferase
MSKTLDLGCGDRPRNPFNADELFGLDVRENLGLNIKSADLVTDPIPYPDASFDFVTAYDFIEHIPRVIYNPTRRNPFVEFMNEVFRVLKPGGYFLSSTPAYPNVEAFQDPTHVNIITDQTFPLYFDNVTRAAAMYGFYGAFHLVTHEWRNKHIYAILQKSEILPATTPKPEINRKVSVFIPVFNGEKLLAQTLDSVLAQTLADFEVICIDDQSTDGSLAILRAYAEKDARIRLYQTPANMGTAPKVLNFGLQFMQGAYFVYSSQDDLFSVDWLEKMQARAIETGADAVIPDLVFYYADEIEKNRSLIGLHGDRNVILPAMSAVYYSLQWEIPGNALWNANLIKTFKFEEFGLNSDEFSVRVFFMNSNKIAFSEGCFYYRQDNPQAITKKTTYKTFDLPYTQYRLYKYLKDNFFPSAVVQQEAIKVLTGMQSLRQWLDANSASMPPQEVAMAMERMQKTMALVKSDPMFAAVI